MKARLNDSRSLFRSGLALLSLVLISQAAWAESGKYRVEVLVFQHLDSQAAAREVEALRSYREFMPVDEFQFPPSPLKLDVMSSMMQDAWRRLRLSATYRPLLFATWEQSRIDYHPPVRLHDEEVITQRLEFPYRLAWIDLRRPDMFAGFRVPYYRLDGTVQLVRSRFLHLHLDLEYRQALAAEPVQPGLPGTGDPDMPGSAAPTIVAGDVLPAPRGHGPLPQETGPRPGPGPALVHQLSQSRQIRTGQVQYFDTPYLGVLARVTATAGE